jgi:hypothetical protein
MMRRRSAARAEVRTLREQVATLEYNLEASKKAGLVYRRQWLALRDGIRRAMNHMCATDKDVLAALLGESWDTPVPYCRNACDIDEM